MKRISNPLKSQQANRLGVAVAIAGVAAAVAASIVLAERPQSDRLFLPSASAAPVTAVAMPTDASLPAAAEALKDVNVEATEAPPTF